MDDGEDQPKAEPAHETVNVEELPDDNLAKVPWNQKGFSFGTYMQRPEVKPSSVPGPHNSYHPKPHRKGFIGVHNR